MAVHANRVELSAPIFQREVHLSRKPRNRPGAVNDSPPREKLCAAGLS